MMRWQMVAMYQWCWLTDPCWWILCWWWWWWGWWWRTRPRWWRWWWLRWREDPCRSTPPCTASPVYRAPEQAVWRSDLQSIHIYTMKTEEEKSTVWILWSIWWASHPTSYLNRIPPLWCSWSCHWPPSWTLPFWEPPGWNILKNVHRVLFLNESSSSPLS